MRGRLNDKELSEKAADRKAQTAKESADRELELAKLAFQAGDPSLLEKLGVTVSSNSTGGQTGNGGGFTSNINELAKQLEYAVSLAKYGKYDLLCSITGMTQEEAALRFSSVEESGYTEQQVKDAARLFMSGDYSKNVLGILKSAYPEFTYSQIWNIWKNIAEYDWLMNIDDSYKGPKA